MKKYYFLILFVLPYGGNAQDVDQYVIGTAGNHAANGNLSLSWTIGEVIIETFEKPFAAVTQGLHQSQITIITLLKDLKVHSLKVYPNPTVDRVLIESTGKNQEFVLYNANGKIILMGKLERPIVELDFSSYATGTYLFRVRDISTHKIIKH